MKAEQRVVRSVRGILLRPATLALPLLIGALSAFAAEPTTEPLLRLETGMHTAITKRVATDAQGRWAVTASEDKTARVWDLATGRQLVVLRPPQDTGHNGKLFAVAMSPDGSTIAIAGWTRFSGENDYAIYLFDRATARLRRPIGGLPNVVSDLAFSDNGERLAASLGGGAGIRVFDTASGKEIGKNSDFGGAPSYSVHFRSDGQRLVATCWDGSVRLYDIEKAGLKLFKRAKVEGGEDPFSARFSPDGTRIAVGFRDTTAVQVLSGSTLDEVARPSIVKVDNGSLGAVAWSADGRFLFAGGKWKVGGRSSVRRWAVDDWNRYEDLPVADSGVMALAPLPGRRMVFVAGDPAWGILGNDGAVERFIRGKMADFRGQRDQFRVSDDGRRVRFGYNSGGKDPCVFDLATASLGLDDPGLPSAPTVPQGLKFDMDINENVRSLALAPGGKRFVVGTEWHLRLFERDGNEVWRQPAPDEVRAVVTTRDSRFVVAVYDDGTIRWHKMSDGAEVLAFFPHADRERWIAWTPEGFFNASPGAEDLIGYHLNRGFDHEGEFIGARQFWETFFQPGLIAHRLDEDGDARIAEAVNKRGDIRQLLEADKTPELELVSPPEAETDGTYSFEVKLKKAGKGQGRLVVRVDGRDLSGRWHAPPLTPGGTTKIPVELASGNHKLSGEFVDSRGISSKPVEVRINVKPSAARASGSLYVLAVGITEYLDSALKLKHAAADASQVVKEFKEQAASYFHGQLDLRTLVDKEATAAEIEKTILDMAKKTGPEDTFVLFMAGHGTVLDEEYYFMPQELEYENDDSLRKNAISQTKIREWMTHLPPRSLLLLDTCRAGNVIQLAARGAEDKNAVSKMIRLSKRAVIAATSAGNVALEGYGDHGVFTWAVLDALKNADYDQNGLVDVTDIAMHVKKLVPKITEQKFGYRQVPMQDTPGEPFAVAKPLAPAASPTPGSPGQQ
jgi:WD40 repeat protein